MTAPHAFLDILAEPQVRDAYLAGRIVLILSADLELLLWVNGAGARFMGFRSVAEALNEPCGFSALTRRSLRESLKSSDDSAVSVQGVEGARDFFVSSITFAAAGAAVFLRSAAPAYGGGKVDLTEGLSDDDLGAALTDAGGRLMAAGNGFNAAVLAEAGLKPLLAEAMRDGRVKKGFLGGDKSHPAGVLRLSENPPVLLLIAAKNSKPRGAAGAPPFRFDPAVLPVRFVWQSNAEGVFTEISPELARAVGPLHAALYGQSFGAFAKARQMDQNGAVRALLQSGNPWAGQALFWPVEGQSFRLKTVLSALPLYDGEKRFLGFRGFGVMENSIYEAGDVMREDDEKNSRNLSRQEQQAFFAIAEQLQSGAFARQTEADKDTDAAQISETAHLPPPPEQSESDIFAELASSVQNELEKEARLQAAHKQREEQAGRERAAGAQAALKAQQEAQKETRAAQGAQMAAQSAPFAAEQTEAARGDAVMQAQRIKELEAELAAARDKADKQNFLLNVISEAVLAVDKTGQIRFANGAAARLFGCPEAELRGSPLSALFTAAGSRDIALEIEQAERDQAGPFLQPGREIEGKAGNNAVKRLRLNFGCLERGKTYFLLLRDMTRFHEIIAGLLRKNREESENFRRQARYLALISHEIRTPLSALLGMAQFMAEEKAGALDNEKYSEYLGDILRAGGHIMTLINDILQVSRDKAEWLKMDIAPLPLLPLLNEALALMIPQANAANIIMRSGVAADLPPVSADSRAVKQILLNLLANAIHFTPAGGQIVISAHMLHEREPQEQNEANEDLPAANRILVRISDTGIGMSEREISRSMRDPLAAGEEISETEHSISGTDEAFAAEQPAALRFARRGAGLGLPMVRALAEANNIRFSLSSEEGRGTVAALVFTAAAAEGRD